MSATQNNIRLTGLARRIAAEGLLSQEAAAEANQAAVKAGQSLISYLVAEKKVDAYTLAHLAAEEFGAPLMDLGVMDIAQAPVKEVEEKLLRRHHALPLFKRGKRLFLGLSDPTNLQAQDEIKFHTGCMVEPVVVEDDKLMLALDKVFESMDDALGDFDDEELDLEVGEEEAGGDKGAVREHG